MKSDRRIDGIDLRNFVCRVLAPPSHQTAKSIPDALENADIDPMLQDAFDAGLKSKDQDSFRTIRQFGPACGIEGAFEGVIHLLSTYDDFQDAIMANVKAGGDSAARGMVVGMVMGAAGKKLPYTWVTGMNGF